VKESGRGTFGKVYICTDTTNGREVAIKVVRRVRRYIEAAAIESDILLDVNKADPEGGSLIVRYYNGFHYREHFCMVFEPLGPSLYDYIKANKYLPPPLYCVQAFADQLLTSVAFLHEMRLIHTDLKLENILLVSQDEFKQSDKVTSSRQNIRVLAPRSVSVRCMYHSLSSTGLATPL
jgi:serine/threonine protein kinase